MTRKHRQRRSYSFENRSHHSWIPHAIFFAVLLLCITSFTIIAVMNQRHNAIGVTPIEKKQDKTTQQCKEQKEVKRKIIEELIVAFQKKNLPVNLDKKSGDITFDGSILFEKNSSTISKAGKKYLEDFFPAYIGVLMSDPFKNQLSTIIIEGHTDSSGSYLGNLDLSQARASSVVRTIYSNGFPDFPQKQDLQKVITANGRSLGEPVYIKGTQNIDAAGSRRVVFKFRLKDDETIKHLNDVLGKSS